MRIVLRDYLIVTSNIDPVAPRARSRMRAAAAGTTTPTRPATCCAGSPMSPSRSWPPGSAHRNTGPLRRRPGGRSDHGPHRGRREPACGLLPRHAGRRTPDRARRLRCRPSPTRSSTSRCPARGIVGLHAQGSDQMAKAGIYDLRVPPRRRPHADPPPLEDLRAGQVSTPRPSIAATPPPGAPRRARRPRRKFEARIARAAERRVARVG